MAGCAVGFVRMARDIKLELSLGDLSKSVLVINSPSVAVIVPKHHAYQGVAINIQSSARDLGILLVGGAGRRTSIQHNRVRWGWHPFQPAPMAKPDLL